MSKTVEYHKRFGRYELLEKIGRGGMGEIFLGTTHGAEGFTKQVVIKRILRHLVEDPRFVRMFIDEAKLSAQLIHGNIVQIHELGSMDGMLYIVMEYVDGSDMTRLIRRAQRLNLRISPELAAYVISCVCLGLHHAHTQIGRDGNPLNIIHRDVSPSNILLSWNGEVKVADFGIAKAATSTDKSRTGALKGKICYMSPEQLEGKIDHRSDIYAAGVLLWEMLVGHRLFRGKNEAKIMGCISAGSIPQASSLVPIPQGLQFILDKALALKREHRFQTADEMADALTTFIFRSGRKTDAREFSAFLHQLFHLETSSGGAGGKPTGVSLTGTITRVAADPQQSMRGGYLTRGIELLEEATQRKVVIIFPDIVGQEQYTFPVFCWKGAQLMASNLRLNNVLKDGSVIYTATETSEFNLDSTPQELTPSEVLSRPNTPAARSEKSVMAIETLVAAAGGVIQCSAEEEPQQNQTTRVIRFSSSADGGSEGEPSPKESPEAASGPPEAWDTPEPLSDNDTVKITMSILEVHTERKIKLSVDGVEIEVSPPNARLNLAAGPHSISFVLDGKRKEMAVEIQAEEICQLDLL